MSPPKWGDCCVGFSIFFAKPSKNRTPTCCPSIHYLKMPVPAGKWIIRKEYSMRHQRTIWKYPVVALGTLVAAVVLFAATPDSPIITSVAGNGTGGYAGDGGAATLAELNLHIGIALDSSGNLYIGDQHDNRIRMVNASGIISTVAGNGAVGFSGDGGAATSAQLYLPTGVALDYSGNLYVADTGNNRIRKVSTSGIITTVAGNGTEGYGGDGGAATSAQLSSPFAVTLDATRNLYITDKRNIRIRRVNTSGIITTVAGDGTAGYGGDGGAATSAQLHDPCGIAVDASGNLYIADNGNNRIRKVSTSGIISTVAGDGTPGHSGDGGAATSAQLWGPVGLALDSSGNLYIAEELSNCIRKVTTSGIISTAAGNGTGGYAGDGGAATLAELNLPLGIALDASGNLYIAEEGNQRIRKVH
jgi:sugar lactone lactonase YvrE